MKKDPSLPTGLFSTTTKTLKRSTIGQALAPCFFKQVAVRSKSLSLAHSLWWFYYSIF